MNTDLHYTPDLPNDISAGVGSSYDLLDAVHLAFGYRSNPDSFAFGVGWQLSVRA